MFQVGDKVECVLNPEVKGVITWASPHSTECLVEESTGEIYMFLSWQLRKVEEKDWFVVGKLEGGFRVLTIGDPPVIRFQPKSEALTEAKRLRAGRAFQFSQGVR